MQVNFWDLEVERKIGIPVYVERQVCGVDWLIQFFYLIVVQLFVRIFQAINGTYKSFLQERVMKCTISVTTEYTVYVKDSQWLSEAQIQGRAKQMRL